MKPLTWGAIRSDKLIIWLLSQDAVNVTLIQTYRYLYRQLSEQNILKVSGYFSGHIDGTL